MTQSGRPTSEKARRVNRIIDLQIAQDDALRAQERARKIAREVAMLTEREPAPA